MISSFNLLGQREWAFSVGHVDLAESIAVLAAIRRLAAGQLLLKIRSQLISLGFSYYLTATICQKFRREILSISRFTLTL